jgi:hypothetical protein
MSTVGRGRGRRQRGSMLLYAIAAVVAVSILATAVAVACTSMTRVSGRQVLDAKLLTMAESGAEYGLHQLAAGRAWDGVKAVPVPGGSCRVSIRAREAGAWLIQSLAVLNGRSREVRIEVCSADPGRLRIAAWSSRRMASPGSPPRPPPRRSSRSSSNAAPRPESRASPLVTTGPAEL